MDSRSYLLMARERNRYATPMKLPRFLPALSFTLVLATSFRVQAEAFSIESAGNGAWSEARTWKPERVPAAGDKVRVRSGHEVLYDVATEDVLPVLHVEGALVFDRDQDTELHVGVLMVGAERATAGAGVADVHDHDALPEHTALARLEIGTTNEPLPANVTARIVLHYVEGADKEEAPVLTCRPGGRVDFHGAPMSRTWLDLGGDAKPGETTITLSAEVTGWAVGDEILVTGEEREGTRDGEFTSETRRLTGIDGTRLTLERALEHVHSGTGRYRCEAANLSRNVVVESADPEGVRGHTMIHRHGAGSISYARFAHLGKEGVLGRYPIHFHLCRDSLRGSSVVGAAIVDSHNRWVTIHNTQYMVVRDCVGFGSVGHGYFLEDGTEVYNVLDRNLGVQAYRGKPLPEQALPFDPNEGGAFWWANGRNTFIRNTACENHEYGYRYDSQKRSNFDSNLPIRMPDGLSVLTDIRTLPIYRFEDNESHSEGLYSFTFAGTDGAGPDTRHPHRIKGSVAWQTHYALRAQIPTMLVEDTLIDRAAYGIYRPWFDHHVYRNLSITRTSTEPFNRGLDDDGEQFGPVTVDGLVFAGFRDNGVPLIQLSDYDPSGKAETHMRGVRIGERNDNSRRALVNMGGGPRPDEDEIAGVPVIIHDLFGPGRGARFVSSRSTEYRADPGKFREETPLTGDESRVAEIPDPEFPQLLDPVDDQPPATIITWPEMGLPVKLGAGGRLMVRGTSTDDGNVRKVTVNGIEARDDDYHFHQWSVELTGLEPGTLILTARAEDEAGNRERTAHKLEITVTE